MNTNRPSSIDWEQSPPGSMVAYARRERSRQTRRKLTVAASAVLLVSAVGWGGFLAFGPRAMREPNYGGVTCSIVRANAMDYMSGTTPDTLTEKIRLHLEQCPECRSYWDEMSAPQMQQTSWLPVHSRSDCDCQACRNRVLHDTPSPLRMVMAMVNPE